MSSLVHLIRKDIIVIRGFIWFVIVYAVIFSFAFQQEQPFMLQGLVPGMLIVLVVGTDAKLPYQQLQVSLPITRRLLVTSKYMTSIFMIVAGSLFVMLCSFSNSFLIGVAWKPDWLTTVGSMMVLLLFTLVYLPLSYWLGQVGAKYINIIMMFLTTAIIAFVSSYLRENPNLDWLVWAEAHRIILAFIMICILAICYIISYSMSVSIFNKKDL